MTAAPPNLKPSRPVSPTAALLLSALVLPGLGQLVTGRLLKGALMAVVPLLWLPLAFVKILRDLFKVMPELSAQAADGAAVTLTGLQEALRPMSGGLIWLLAPLAAVWLWSLVDSISFARRSRSVEEG
ncbi:MAG: hypothetical protein LBV79_00525 [Candidatus Adiutrix sp.]|jgi:hypothetical protein|nr:hypothetical protein [Candidatus Adiutrix sp.]